MRWMSKIPASLLLAICLCLAPAAAEALTLEEIIKLHEVGVSDKIIINTIEDSGEVFNLDATDIAELKEAGVSDAVIEALMATADGGGGDRDSDRDRDRGDADRDDGDRDRVRGGPPREVKEALDIYKQRRFYTASLRLFLMLDRQKYPEQEVRLTFYLGDSVYRLGFVVPAMEFFEKVVKEGEGTPYYGPALTKLAEIARFTGDISTLVRLIDGVDPQDYPEKAMDDLYYAAGVRMFDDGNYAKALKYFREVSTSSEVYYKARYFEGVIYNKQGRLKNADNAFKQLVRSSDLRGDPDEIERVRHLALMNLARIRYGIEKPKDAAKFYELMPRSSSYWPNAIFERAYSHFQDEGMENYALGDLLTVSSPFYADFMWNPEAEFLKALVFWSLCEYGEVMQVLNGFRDYYTPLRDDIREFVDAYDEDADNARSPADAYLRLYGSDSDEYRMFPVALYGFLERSNNFMGQHKTVLEIQTELDTLANSRPQWRDSELGDFLRDRLEKKRRTYQKRAGRLLLFELNRVAADLSSLLASEQLLRFEVVNGQYEKYRNLSKGPLQEIDERLEIDFATDPERVFWPFNDEFWSDELGGYIYTEKGSCKE